MSFTYTDHGTLASRTVSSATTTYTYDVFGQLREVDLPSPGPTITYGVDALGRRISRDDGTTVNRYVYSGDRLIAEVDDEGAPERRYVYASRGHVPDLMVTGSGVYRLITDHLGSVRLVVHVDTGAIAQRMDYDPWGDVTEDTSPGFQAFGFAGGLYDHETGLVRFGARDYDAEVGRWTAKDPIGFGGGDGNLYGYCGGDPVNLVDPSGLESWETRLGSLSAGIGDGILSTLSLGLVNGSKIRDLVGGNSVVDPCSVAYIGGRAAGTAATLAVYAGGAIPRTLTHFTSASGAAGIAKMGQILPSTGATLFGDGVYATAGSRVLVPGAATIPIEVAGSGFMRILPNAVFLKGGSKLTAAWFGGYGLWANRNALSSNCGCK